MAEEQEQLKQIEDCKPQTHNKWPILIGRLFITGGVLVILISLIRIGRDVSSDGVLPKLIAPHEAAMKNKLINATPKPTQAQRQPVRDIRDIHWQSSDRLLASTPARRLNAMQKLGIARGESIVLMISVLCTDCDREAQELNEKLGNARIIGLAVASEPEIAAWKEKLGLKYPVYSVTEGIFEDIGVVLLPTIIHFRNGEAIACSEYAEVLN